jgi:uncharacterized protein YjbJ (UPF0337 family)
LQVGRQEYVARITDRNLPIFEASGPLAGIHYQEHMNMNKDQLKGRVEEAKGTIKEATGKLVGDETLEAKGNIQKNLGKVQEKVGDVKQDVKDSVI